MREMSKVMEAIARQDLDTRLGTMRRPVPADSTAGVSLSGLTGSEPSRKTAQVLIGSQANLAAQQTIKVRSHIETQTDSSCSELLTHPIEVVSLTPANSESGSVGYYEAGSSDTVEKFRHDSLKTMSMVFHVMRSDDSSRQDIVSMSDIFDYSINSPSWVKFVELLSVENGLGPSFKDGSEFLLVNDLIRVANKRQFLACVQYLFNSGVLNAEVYVCRIGEMTALGVN